MVREHEAGGGRRGGQRGELHVAVRVDAGRYRGRRRGDRLGLRHAIALLPTTIHNRLIHFILAPPTQTRHGLYCGNDNIYLFLHTKNNMAHNMIQQIPRENIITLLTNILEYISIQTSILQANYNQID